MAKIAQARGWAFKPRLEHLVLFLLFQIACPCFFEEKTHRQCVACESRFWPPSGGQKIMVAFFFLLKKT